MGLREVYEIVELGVAEVEFVHGRDAVVRLDEFKGVAIDDTVKHERIYQAAVVRGGKFDVRGDSASVANDAESYYYEYDEFSRLKKKTYRSSGGKLIVCYNFTYSEVGNISHIKIDYQYNNNPDEWEYSVEYADIPAKTAPLQFLDGDMFAEIFELNEWVLMEAGLLGNTSPHLLIQSLTETGLDDDFMSLFSYKLDKNGYVSEMTAVSSASDWTDPEVVTCNFTWEKSSVPSFVQWHLSEK